MLSWPGSSEDVSVDVFVAQDGSVPVWRKCVWAFIDEYFSSIGFSWYVTRVDRLQLKQWLITAVCLGGDEFSVSY